MYDLDILVLYRSLPECQTLIKRRRSAMKVSKAAKISFLFGWVLPQSFLMAAIREINQYLGTRVC
jgi:hypothetical protein